MACCSKYKAKGLGELADEVAAMLKHVKRFEEALASPTESRFVVVTRGEELAASRTERLVEYLKEKKLRWSGCWSTACGPKSTCPKCREPPQAGAQRGQGHREEDRPARHRGAGARPSPGGAARAEGVPHRVVRAVRPGVKIKAA